MTLDLSKVKIDWSKFEANVCENSLYEFVVRAWSYVEPAEFIPGWHIKAICEHLEAVTRGDISKLLINQPPGTSKSLIISIFWCAWEWARNPSVRWFYASYDQRLSTRDSVSCRSLINSPWYQSLWGDKFQLTGDQNLKIFYETDKKGYRLATSTGGHGTGEHPDRIVCFPYYTTIYTDKGDISIGRLVEERINASVASFNHSTYQMEFQKISAYEEHKHRPISIISFFDRPCLESTTDHLFYVVGRGYIPAEDLAEGDRVLQLKGGYGTNLDVKIVAGVGTSDCKCNKVYNIRVENNHNYFADGILVHNCDDPHSVQQAESEVELQSTIEWWTQTMSTRGVSRNARRVIVMQRLRPDDLSGYVLKNDNYVFLCLPMRYEPNRMISTPLGWNDPRKVEGELLTPNQFNEEQVLALEKTLGPYGTACQLQQNPIPRTGGMFHRDWFNNRVKAAPYQIFRVRFWDKAATQGAGAATAGTLMGVDKKGNFYIEDVVWGQWEPDERDEMILATAQKDRARYGPSYEPIIYAEREPGSSGKDSFQYIARKLAGFKVFEDLPTGKKEVRAEPFASQCAAKNVYLVDNGESEGYGKSTWDINAWLDEICLFPLGKLKDRVDSASGAFIRLTNKRRTGTLYVRTFGKRKSGEIRIFVCSKEEVATLKVEDRSLLIVVEDPLVESDEPIILDRKHGADGEQPPKGHVDVNRSNPSIPSHVLTKLLDQKVLRFVDMEPADFQDKWGEKIPPWNLPVEDLVMKPAQGKKFWSIITKKRDPSVEVFVFVDNGGEDRRAVSLAHAVCEIMNLDKEKSIVHPSVYYNDEDEVKLNKHVVQTVKKCRGMVV